jgi:phosphoglycerate dehydrogenase-like enzyme
VTNQLRIFSHVPSKHLEPVRRAHPDVEIVEIPRKGPIEGDLRAEILLTQPWASPNLAEIMARGVRWVHAFGTGVDRFPVPLLGNAILTCSRGASATAISEWVLAVMLAAEKRLPESWIDEPPARWSMASLGSLADKKLGLIGFGEIAQAIARRALPFGMRIAALRRTNTKSAVEGVEIDESLETLLAEADHVVVTAPLTPATHHLLGTQAFAMMKPGVHLVNISRGGLVDHDALRNALGDDGVSLASLDCVEPEPVPEGHWLYSHPRVRLSAHVSWNAPAAYDGLIDPFVENLGRYRRGEELGYRVDPKEGY